jgi:iron(III) transport system permease protein
LPYAVRSSAAILKQIKGGIEEAALSLGAPPWRAFAKVTLPLMVPGIVAGALMSFITAINASSQFPPHPRSFHQQRPGGNCH